jgi:hypothetical protein
MAPLLRRRVEQKAPVPTSGASQTGLANGAEAGLLHAGGGLEYLLTSNVPTASQGPQAQAPPGP